MNFQEIVRELILIEPYLGHFLLGIHKEFSNEIPTACVTFDGINVKMQYNKDFCNKLTEKQQVGLMWHEVEHIVNFHMCPSFYDSFDDKELLNIAEDIHINQYIAVDYLPPKALLPSTFPNVSLPDFQDTRTYYDLLKENQEGSSPDPKLKSLLDHMKSGGDHPYDHSPHRQNAAKDEAGCDMPIIDSVVRNQIENRLKDSLEQSKISIGNTPSHLRGLLDKITNKKKPAVDWKAALRRFGSRSNKTMTKITRRKPNIRFPDSPTIKIKTRKKMAVAIDTSGSVSNKELNDFFDQIDHIVKTGTEVEIIECDARIGRIYDYKNRSMVGNVTGGGGTCAQPVLELINSNHKYNSVVYFTDGGLFDSQKKKGLKPVLWIITSNGTTNFNFDGLKIKIPKETEV